MTASFDIQALNQELSFTATAEANQLLSDVVGNPLAVDLVLRAAGLNPRQVAGQDSHALLRVITGVVTETDVADWASDTRFMDADMVALVSSSSLSAAALSTAEDCRVSIVDAADIASYWRTGGSPSDGDISTCWLDVAVTLVYQLSSAWQPSGPVEVDGPDGWVPLSEFSAGVFEPGMSETFAPLTQELPIPEVGRWLTRRNKVAAKGRFVLRSASDQVQSDLHVVISTTITNTGKRTEQVFEGVRSRFVAEVTDPSSDASARVDLDGAPTRVFGPLDKVRRNLEQTLPDDSLWSEHIADGFAEKLSEYCGQDPVAPEDVAEHYRLLAERIGPIATASIPTHKEQWYFRARGEFNNHEVLRSDLSEFGVPPAQLVGLGRANLAGHPVFYGADRPNVAVREVMPWKEGARVYVSSWRSNRYRPRYVRALPAGLSATERINRERQRTQTSIESSHRHLGRAAADALEQILVGLGRVFLDDKDYALSSLIAHHHLYENGADGVEYPDVATESAFNYALGPAMTDQLELHRVFLFRLHADHLDPIDVGIPDDQGHINWQTFDADPCERLIPPDAEEAGRPRAT